MFHNFDEIESHLLSNGIRKRIALCGAHDEAALSAVVDAHRKGVADAALIGDAEKIREILDQMEEPAEDYEIIDKPAESRGALQAMKLVHAGEADIPMKGLMQTTSFVTAMANPVYGIMDFDAMMTHLTAFYYPERGGFLFASDTSFTKTPTLEEKVTIINNALPTMRAFGLTHINVGVISAVETVRQDVPSTLDAEALSQMEWPDDVTVEGPFALDNAISVEAAEHKGIADRPGAGRSDLLLLPDFIAGNILYKSVHYFGHLPEAGMVCGTRTPAIVASRSDEPDAKYNAILAAIVQSLALEGADVAGAADAAEE